MSSKFQIGDLVKFDEDTVLAPDVAIRKRRALFVGIVVGEGKRKMFGTASYIQVIWLTGPASSLSLYKGRPIDVVPAVLRKAY